MVRGRSLGPQWLRGQGVTPVVSSDGLKQIKASAWFLYKLKLMKTYWILTKTYENFIKIYGIRNLFKLIESY